MRIGCCSGRGLRIRIPKSWKRSSARCSGISTPTSSSCSTRSPTGCARVFRTENALTLPISGTGSAGHGSVLRQPARAGRHRDHRRERRVRRAHVRGRAPVRRRGRARRTTVGPRHRSAAAARRAARRNPHARLLAVVHAETSTGVENEIAPLAALQQTDTLLARRHRHVARRHPRRGRRRGASTPCTRARRSASACRPASRR